MQRTANSKLAIEYAARLIMPANSCLHKPRGFTGRRYRGPHFHIARHLRGAVSTCRVRLSLGLFKIPINRSALCRLQRRHSPTVPYVIKNNAIFGGSRPAASGRALFVTYRRDSRARSQGTRVIKMGVLCCFYGQAIVLQSATQRSDSIRAPKIRLAPIYDKKKEKKDPFVKYVICQIIG